MKNTLFALCLWLVPSLTVAQQSAPTTMWSSSVVDADTGEPLPCVGIRVSQGRTTLTNFDGEFGIEAAEADTLRRTARLAERARYEIVLDEPVTPQTETIKIQKKMSLHLAPYSFVMLDVGV